MRGIILEVKAEAEAELLMAKAKIAVAESILAKYDHVAEKTDCAPVEEVVAEAPVLEEQVTIEHFTDDIM
jgi:hypothetical protein